ncbi:MAG: hypothetical protein OES24_13075 [Acidimicrobiia bacterium]|nr:hypothetical protein [Acidimicrobiia bacterium]
MATPAETVERTFKPIQQFVRGWMLTAETEAYGRELGLRNLDQFWIVGRAGVLGSCPTDVAAGALAFHGPDKVAEAWGNLPAGLDHATVARHYHSRCVAWGDEVVGDFDAYDMNRLDELGRRIVDAAPNNVGPLFVGWRIMPIPDGHGARVALTLHVIRELRAAAHSCAIVVHGLTPVEAILASTNAPLRTGPGHAEFMGFTGPFRDPEEVRAQRLAAEATTATIMSGFYAVLSDGELDEFADLVESTRSSIDM